MPRSHAAADRLDEDALRETIRHRVEAAGDLVLLGDAPAAAGAPRRHVRDLCLLPRGRRHRRRRAAGRAQARGAGRLARRDRRDLCRAAAPSRRPARCASRCGAISFAARTFSPSSTAWRWMLARTSARPTSRPSTSIARASRAPSAISRCMSSAIRAPPRMRSPIRSAGRCSSPTSCAISPRTPRGGRLYLPREILDRHGIASCRAGRGAAPSGIAGGLPRSSRRSPKAISREADAAMARCSRRAMRPAAVMAAILPRDAFGAAARRDGATRRAGSASRSSLKLWLVLRHGLI